MLLVGKSRFLPDSRFFPGGYGERDVNALCQFAVDLVQAGSAPGAGGIDRATRWVLPIGSALTGARRGMCFKKMC